MSYNLRRQNNQALINHVLRSRRIYETIVQNMHREDEMLIRALENRHQTHNNPIFMNIMDILLRNMTGSDGAERHRGLTTQQIENVVTNHIYNELSQNTRSQNTICPITLDHFNDDSEVSVLRNCGHVFFRQPLRTWLTTRDTCPMCRTNVITSAQDEFLEPQPQPQPQTQPQPEPQPDLFSFLQPQGVSQSLSNNQTPINVSETEPNYNFRANLNPNATYFFTFPTNMDNNNHTTNDHSFLSMVDQLIRQVTNEFNNPSTSNAVANINSNSQENQSNMSNANANANATPSENQSQTTNPYNYNVSLTSGIFDLSGVQWTQTQPN